MRRLSNRNLLDFIPLGDNISIEEIAPPSAFIGKSLVELDLRNRFGVQVVGLRDVLTGTVSLNPSPNQRILDSHALLVLGVVLGARLAHRFAERVLKAIVAGVLITVGVAMASRIIYAAWLGSRL